MELGECVSVRVFALNRVVAGTVVYIHPENRYCVVEFKAGGGRFREAYKIAKSGKGKTASKLV